MLKTVCLLLALSGAAWGHYRTDDAVRVIEIESAGFPAWSPNGQQLAFSARPGEFTQIFVLDIETGTVNQLTDCAGQCEHATWSPDAAHIAYRLDVPFFSQLMSIRADGTAQLEMTAAVDGGRASHPAWSPRGDEIAFSANRLDGVSGIAVLDLGTRVIRQVAGSEFGLEDPAWSPGGERLIAWDEGHFDGVLEGRLYEIDPSSTGPPTVLMRDPGGFRDPSWIDGGNSVLYRTLRSSVNRLFVQNLGRFEPREIGPVTMRRIHPALSPDGSTLAFVGQGDGNRGIWFARFSEVPSSVEFTTWAMVKRHFRP